MAEGTKKRRTKGNGSIFKNGDYYYLQHYVNGKKVVKSLRTKNKTEAERKASTLLPDFALQTREDVVSKVAELKRLKTKDRVKLSRAWDMFYNSKLRRTATSEGTLANYRYMYNDFYQWLRKHYPTLETLSEITRPIAEEYAKDFDRRNITGNTYNYYIGALKTITAALMHEAGLTENVWMFISKKPVESIGKKPFTEEEVRRIFAALDDDEFKLMNKEQMKMLCHISYFTAMRLADCALLQWKDINMKTDIISLIATKTKGHRKRITVPIKPAFKEKLLAAADAWGTEQYVLPAVADRYKRNACGVREDAVTILEYAGLEVSIDMGRQRKTNQYGFHSWRHTFCSNAASNGMPITHLAEITGDSIATLQKYYVKIQHKALHRAAEAIPNIPLTVQEAQEEEIPTHPTAQEDLLAQLQNAPDLTEREKMMLELLSRKEG